MAMSIYNPRTGKLRKEILSSNLAESVNFSVQLDITSSQ